MFRIVIIQILLYHFFWLKGEQKVHFALPQNIYTKGEKIAFLIRQTEASHTTTPVIITVQTCNDLKIILKHLIDVDFSNPGYSFTLPENIHEGSYVISASIPELNSPKIVERHSGIFHITDQGKGDQYYTFKKNENSLQKLQGDKTQYLQIRTEHPDIAPSDNFVFTIDQSFLYKDKIQSAFYPGVADTIHRIFFLANPNNNIVVFFPSCLKPYNLKSSNEKGYVACPLTAEVYHQPYFVFDVFANKTFEMKSSEFITDLALSDLVIMGEEDINHINNLAENAALTEKINLIIFDNNDIETNIIKNESLPDNVYNLNDYQEFESLTLFIKEVVLPAKIGTSSNSKNQLKIILLSGVNKKWYPDKALLMIDDRPSDDHDVIKELSWKDIATIQIYRKTETLRKYYGAMGKNGVIEIKTKKYNNTTLTPKSKIQKFPMFLPILKEDTQPYFKPLQFVGKVNNLKHGDRKGKFYLIEFGPKKLLMKSHYEVQ